MPRVYQVVKNIGLHCHLQPSNRLVKPFLSHEESFLRLKKYKKLTEKGQKCNLDENGSETKEIGLESEIPNYKSYSEYLKNNMDVIKREIEMISSNSFSLKSNSDHNSSAFNMHQTGKQIFKEYLDLFKKDLNVKSLKEYSSFIISKSKILKRHLKNSDKINIEIGDKEKLNLLLNPFTNIFRENLALRATVLRGTRRLWAASSKDCSTRSRLINEG